MLAATAALVRVVTPQKNLPRADGVAREFDERTADVPSRIVINLLEISFGLRLALDLALAPVEPVGINEKHAAEMRGDEPQIGMAVEDAAVDDARDRERRIRRPKNLLVQRKAIPVRLARSVGGMEKQRLAGCNERRPERLLEIFVEVFSRQIRRQHHAVHAQFAVAALHLAERGVHVEHRETRERLEAARVLRVRVGELVVQNSAQLQGARPVAALLDPAAGVRQHADIDAVAVHDVEVFAVVERMEAGAARVVRRLLRHTVQVFTGKRVKVRVDDHRYFFSSSVKNPSASSSWRKLKSTHCSGRALFACGNCDAARSSMYWMPFIVG